MSDDEKQKGRPRKYEVGAYIGKTIELRLEGGQNVFGILKNVDEFGFFFLEEANDTKAYNVTRVIFIKERKPAADKPKTDREKEWESMTGEAATGQKNIEKQKQENADLSAKLNEKK